MSFVLLSSTAIDHSVRADAQVQQIETSQMSEQVPKEIRRLQAKGYINAVAWNADASRLAAVSEYGTNIRIWDSKTWKVVSEFYNPGAAYMNNSLAFLTDGSLLTTPMSGKLPHFRWFNGMQKRVSHSAIFLKCPIHQTQARPTVASRCVLEFDLRQSPAG
jgi:WD40 repeat protein